MSKQYKVIAKLDYVIGYLRCGNIEMILDEDEYKKFISLSLKEQIEWLENEGDVEITDYSIEDYGDIQEKTLTIEEI